MAAKSHEHTHCFFMEAACECVWRKIFTTAALFQIAAQPNRNGAPIHPCTGSKRPFADDTNFPQMKMQENGYIVQRRDREPNLKIIRLCMSLVIGL